MNAEEEEEASQIAEDPSLCHEEGREGHCEVGLPHRHEEDTLDVSDVEV